MNPPMQAIKGSVVLTSEITFQNSMNRYKAVAFSYGMYPCFRSKGFSETP